MRHRRPNGAWFSEADEYAVRRAQAGPPGREALERNAPNLLADYLYLWEITVVRQAIETATISVSSGGDSSTDPSQSNHSRRIKSRQGSIPIVEDGFEPSVPARSAK